MIDGRGGRIFICFLTQLLPGRNIRIIYFSILKSSIMKSTYNAYRSYTIQTIRILHNFEFFGIEINLPQRCLVRNIQNYLLDVFDTFLINTNAVQKLASDARTYMLVTM